MTPARRITATLALALAAALPAAAQNAPTDTTAATVRTADPAAVAAALAAMGYRPGAVEPNGGAPLFKVDIADFDTAIVFGGCANGSDCRYLVLVSRFTDVLNPPADWVNAHNRDLDLGKLWVGDDGTLAFALAMPTGGEPISVPTLRFVIEQWTGVIGTLSRAAIDAKLIK
jgi:hypothetical protein